MRQLLFEELFVGTLVSTIVLGFFDDVASIAEATSFSYIFLAAIILEVLTCAAVAVVELGDTPSVRVIELCCELRQRPGAGARRPRVK